LREGLKESLPAGKLKAAIIRRRVELGREPRLGEV
jgi:hypothetical protein